MAPVDESRPALPADGAAARKEMSLGELAEKLSGRITTGLVLAAAVIGLAIYSRPAPPRYEAVVGDGKVVRIDTRSGTVIACEAGGCATILRKGQRLGPNPNRRPALKPAAPPAQAPAVSGPAPAAPPPRPPQ